MGQVMLEITAVLITEGVPITIRGIGETRSVFDADGLNVSGRGGIPRGIFQIEGAYYII